MKEPTSHSNRLDLRADTKHWPIQVADKVVELFPNAPQYTLAAGTSPSGTVHIGNLRDVMIVDAVARELTFRRHEVRIVFSWDNFDRFRKVPANVPASWQEHIGKPLSKVPDPSGMFPSYAERWQQDFEQALKCLDIVVDYRYQTAQYEAGVYDVEIVQALACRKQIAQLLVSKMSKKALAEKKIDPERFVDEFSPLTIYSRFTGKDNTTYLGHSGSKVTYRCNETGKEDTVDLTIEHIAKLGWKIDWPMRWKHEKVVFEPGGKDHAAPGGSYDVSSEIAAQIYGIQAPVFVGYEFIGVQGLKGKMSGSAGNAITPGQLLEIYEPNMLRWLYNKRAPGSAFNFAFDSDTIRQYDEFDRLHPDRKVIPFRQAVALGQIVQWDTKKLQAILAGTGNSFDSTATHERLVHAKNWLEVYNPEEAILVRDSLHADYLAQLSPAEKEQIRALHDFLIQNPTASIADIEAAAYQIPRTTNTSTAELAKQQRAFFKNVYQLLISRDTGPRLGTFLYVIDRQRTLQLLNVGSV